MKKTKSKKFWTLLVCLAFIGVFSLVSSFLLKTEEVFAESNRYDVVTSSRNISTGVTETKYITNDKETNNDQVIAYAVKVDLSGNKNTLIAGYRNYDNSGNWGLQTVRDQAKAAENKRGVKVVAAVNGDFFNMGTGEPAGALVMNGKTVHVADGTRSYFAILEDGSAVIGTGALPSGVKEAIGGSTIMLVDGEIDQSIASVYEKTKQPRTAIGIDADGNVIIMAADGRQSPYSSGYSLYDLAQKMKEAGCVTAMNLDGGGSTTYLAKYEGTDELTLANSPSDGQERSVSSTLMVVSYAEPTGIFDSAVISPNQEVYTPGSSINVSAIGADTAGFACGIPQGAVWQVAGDTQVSGAFSDVVYDGGKYSAVFVADAGSIGTAKLQLVYEGQVVGQSELEFQNPTSFTVKNSVVSLDFGEETDFGLEGHWNAREVHIKDGDIDWTIGETGNEEYPSIGVMKGNVFVADSSATNVTATVTAKLKVNPLVTVSIEVSVGQLPTVAWNGFEDVVQEDDSVIEAEDYYTIGSDGYFNVTFSKEGIGGSAKIVDASDGEVRVGQNALQINYDFTQTTPTAGVYFGPREEVHVPGHPTGLGVWVYIPEGTPNFWFRSYIYGLNEDGTEAPGNVAWGGDPAYVCDFNKAGQDPYNEGWYYFEADLTNFTSPAYTYVLKGQTFRIMYVSGSGASTKGFIYLDNFQFVYGANTDDLYAPEIDNVMIGQEQISDGMTISDDPFAISAQYHDFDEQYSTGINSENVHVYIDGNEIALAFKNEMELVTESISLANGVHEIRIDIYDNFQNLKSVSYKVNVKNDKEYDKVYLKPDSESAILGSDFKVDLFATDPSRIENITFELRLPAGFTLSNVSGGTGFTSSFEVVHVNNNIYKITFTSNGTYENAGENGLVGSVLINCPSTLLEGSVLSYNVVSSQVVFKDGYQSGVQNSFSSETNRVEVVGRYSFIVDTMIVGSNGGWITVIDSQTDLPAAGVTVYVDGVAIGVTDSEGKIFTDLFIAQACVKAVYADDGKDGISFTKNVYGVLAGGATDQDGNASAQPVYVRSVAAENGNTQQRITWMSNPVAANNKAFIKFATKADYDLKGEAAFETFEGNCVLLAIDGNGNVLENFAVYVNQVLLGGLKENTEYVYIVGDGTVWTSEVKTFNTSKHSGETSFVVLGDTQADNPVVFNNIGSAIKNSDINYSFILQTGDFVDSGSRYSLWSNILDVFSQYISDIDFAAVFGNHEYEGDADASNAANIHYTPSDDYYSYTYGNVYVAVINCFTRTDMEEAIAWIKQDAANSDAIWKVLSMHRPPYFTNVSGGSDTVHEMIPSLVDEAGFDVVFSGHDHTYARTKPMTGGVVDENGAVYYIVGAAEEGGKYDVTNNPEFNFEIVSEDFNAVYMSVTATDTNMTITAYNMKTDGAFEVLDEYTIVNSCSENGHDFVYDNGVLICGECHYTVEPSEIGFSGMIQNTQGQNMMFAGGEVVSGWMQYLDEDYYFDENGVGVQGTLTVNNRYGEPFEFVFENGKVVGGGTGWADNGTRYFIDGKMHLGWYEIDGEIYYFASGNEVGEENKDRIGQKLTNGSYLIKTPTVPYMTNYTVTFDADGKCLHGDFHKASAGWVYTKVQKPADLNGLWISYYFNQWVDTEYGRFYAQSNSVLATGDVVIDGVRYLFGTEGSSPKEGLGKLLGKCFIVNFVNGDDIIRKAVVENGTVSAIDDPLAESNSIKTVTFDGWYCKDVKFTPELVITQDMTFEAKFEVVYTQSFLDLKNGVDALKAAYGGSMETQINLLNVIYDALNNLSETELSDAKAEGVDLSLYFEVTEKYNQALADSEEDLKNAQVVSKAFLNITQAAALLAALGIIAKLRRI